MSGEVYPDYDLLPPEQVPLDAPTLYELYLWDYLSNAYAKWYEGSEECPEEDAQLEDNFRAFPFCCLFHFPDRRRVAAAADPPWRS